MTVSSENSIPIAALNHYAYCPHRCWRIFCAGEFVDNHYTVEGSSLHARVHTIGQIDREDVSEIRAIWLKSDRYRLIGKSDLIELDSGVLYPVEYKRGKRADWDNDALQVCGQALCLEEMTGKAIAFGYIYYTHSHQRQKVEIDRDLRVKTMTAISDIQAMMKTGKTPLPTYQPRCKGCSLYSRCLPRLARKVELYQE